MNRLFQHFAVHSPSNRALDLQTPPLKFHLIRATKQMITPMTAISVVVVL